MVLFNLVSVDRKWRYRTSFRFDDMTPSPSKNALAISKSPSLASTSPTNSSMTFKYPSLHPSILFLICGD